uniref:2-dehydro-3-deoxygalactonokinase n=1 Tax=Hafnia alvei TaxID=569 RepID=UPI0026ECB5A6|nr:2-dehydro-3-deoxygalactonokinase [Hafnia alvei]
MNNHWIAIDWGTSNFRAFLMNHNQCIDTVNAHCGLLSVPDRQFDAALLPLDCSLAQSWRLYQKPKPGSSVHQHSPSAIHAQPT